jgi:hypothetical protein
LASRHQKGKRRSLSQTSESLIIVIVLVLIVTFFFLFILTVRTILGVVIGSLHGRNVNGRKRSKRILFKRRHESAKLVELIYAPLLG